MVSEYLYFKIVYKLIIGQIVDQTFKSILNCNGMIYLLTAVGLTPSGSSTVHIYTQKNKM
jgi:hypothetical protein